MLPIIIDNIFILVTTTKKNPLQQINLANHKNYISSHIQQTADNDGMGRVNPGTKQDNESESSLALVIIHGESENCDNNRQIKITFYPFGEMGERERE